MVLFINRNLAKNFDFCFMNPPFAECEIPMDFDLCFVNPPFAECEKHDSKEVDDSEEWSMTEREFHEWYYTHSHKETTAFYNFMMEDTICFRKTPPRNVEMELYRLWKEDPLLFTDMVNEFEGEDVDEYTY